MPKPVPPQGDYIQFDATQLSDLGKELRLAGDRLRPAVEVATLKTAFRVAETAKVIVGKYSTSIPPTIHALPGPKGSAFVRAGGPDVPLAGLYEMGNRGRGRGRKTFWHPVFGNRSPGAEQPRHRFLLPAMTANRKNFYKDMQEAWDKAMKPTGQRTKWTEMI